CVELTGSGNTLGWSDAAMINLCKALELACNHGIDEITGAQLCADRGGLGIVDDRVGVRAAEEQQHEAHKAPEEDAEALVEHAAHRREGDEEQRVLAEGMPGGAAPEQVVDPLEQRAEHDVEIGDVRRGDGHLPVHIGGQGQIVVALEADAHDQHGEGQKTGIEKQRRQKPRFPALFQYFDPVHSFSPLCVLKKAHVNSAEGDSVCFWRSSAVPKTP
ncbi:MAG: hypothetical protein IKD61_00235, partial [Oscillospiraceae bacterium]|nr:hypothetical protein [Oscillospiraceae bacterium]